MSYDSESPKVMNQLLTGGCGSDSNLLGFFFFGVVCVRVTIVDHLPSHLLLSHQLSACPPSLHPCISGCSLLLPFIFSPFIWCPYSHLYTPSITFIAASEHAFLYSSSSLDRRRVGTQHRWESLLNLARSCCSATTVTVFFFCLATTTMSNWLVITSLSFWLWKSHRTTLGGTDLPVSYASYLAMMLHVLCALPASVLHPSVMCWIISGASLHKLHLGSCHSVIYLVLGAFSCAAMICAPVQSSFVKLFSISGWILHSTWALRIIQITDTPTSPFSF